MTWRIFTMYMLLILFILLAGHVSAQVTVTHYNAEWNKTNDVKWLKKLSDCNIAKVDIVEQPKLQKKHKIVVVPTIIVFNGDEVERFQANIMMQMEATRKDGQNIIIESKESRLAVFLDPKLLSHILINLLSNAIKYSDANQNILIKIIRTNTHFSVVIIDKGIGIPEAEQKNLFQRFYRAENATNIQGTGLGLHIVKQYVDLMEGNVDFKSEVGKGTSFKVELPITMMMD